MHDFKVRIVNPKDRKNPEIRWTEPDGKIGRISAGASDKKSVQLKLEEVKAKLLLGATVDNQRSRKRSAKATTGENTPWTTLSHNYRNLKLVHDRETTINSESPRLDCFDRILGETPIVEIATKPKLSKIKQQLLKGQGSLSGKVRTKSNVNTYLRVIRTVLNWAHKDQGILDAPVSIQMLKVDNDEGEAKGRPITEAEFDLMLEASETVCPCRTEETKLLLKGIYYSGLRLDEAMNFTLSDRSRIHIDETPSGVVIVFPAAKHKKARRSTIATIPDFQHLIASLPNDRKDGFVFRPAMQNGRKGRPQAKCVGRTIIKIGEEANIVVNDSGSFAGAHSLRRGFAQRMADLGMVPKDLMDIMRHSSIETTMKYYTSKNAAAANERISKLFN